MTLPENRQIDKGVQHEVSEARLRDVLTIDLTIADNGPESAH